MKRRTLRGVTLNGETKRLILDDGRLNHGFRVVRFQVFPVDVASGASDSSGVLSLDYDGLTQVWRADDNRQIAWSSTAMGAAYSVTNETDIIDPDHVVIMDLWIQAWTTGTDLRINYIVEVEPVELSNDEAILSLIKERSQDDLR
jgi:hypothetical protein